jgi:hypothetical protein
MNITSFDRTNLRIIHDEINAALKPIAEKYGITFTDRGARFNPTNATFKIESSVVSSDGVVQSSDRQSFTALAPMYGLQSSDLDRLFLFRGEGYTITGLKPRSPKSPILAVSKKNGKTYKFTVDMVKGGLV